MLRGEILTALAMFGHDLTLDEASKRFQAFLENRNTPLLPPDIRKVGCSVILMHEISLQILLLIIIVKCWQAAYVAVMQRASKSNRSGYESLLKVYKEADLSQEKTRILGNEMSCMRAYHTFFWVCILIFSMIVGSLASSRDPDLILEALNFMLSSEVTFLQIFYKSECTYIHYQHIIFLFMHNGYSYVVNLLYIVKVRSQDAVFGLAVTREGRDVAWAWLKV